jgi:hypothetical protein
MSTVTSPRTADSRVSPPLGERALLACALRDEWLAHGLSTQPADRPAAEAAVVELYRLIGEPAPRFQWTSSPPAALALLRDDPRFRLPRLRLSAGAVPAGSWPPGSRLASLLSDLRARLEDRAHPLRRNASWFPTRGAAASGTAHREWLDAGHSVDALLDAAVYRALRTSVHDSVCAPLRTAWLGQDISPGLTWYGQHDAHWVGDYEVRHRAGVSTYRSGDVHRLGQWAQLARSTGWWWPGAGLCVMAERPVELSTAPIPGARHGEVRLHHPDRPAVRYADGAEVYVLDGTPVPSWVIDGPTVERIHAEPNIEVRRAAIERLGWDAYIDQAGLQLVATAPDPGNPGSTLRLYHLPRQVWGSPVRVLLVVNGSVEPDGRHRRYGLSVPADIDDPVAAAGWSYGLNGPQYAQRARRT